MNEKPLRSRSLSFGLERLHEHMAELVVVHELICDDAGRPVDYRILDTNPAFSKVTGIPWERANGRLASEVYQQTPPPYLEIYGRVAQTGIAEQFETYYAPMRKHFQISAFCPEPGMFVTVAVDVTLRVEKEREARWLNRLYATLSAINQMVVRVESEHELLETVGHAMLLEAGFALACIGRRDGAAGKLLPRLAMAKKAVDKRQLLADVALCMEYLTPGNTSDANFQPMIIELEADAPHFSNWQRLVREHELASCAAFPLYDEKGFWGNLLIGSTEREAFGEKEKALLEEVAGDVSFALKRLQAEARQKRYTELLAEQERQMQTLLMNIPGGVYRCEVEAPWRVLFFSQGSEAITGRPVSDFIEGKLSYADMVHPEDLEELDRLIKESVANRQPYEATYRIIRPDGTFRWVFEKGRACYDAAGRPVFLEGIILDITAQREAESSLQASQRELEAVYEQTPVIMMLLDEQLKVVRANRTARRFADDLSWAGNVCFKSGPGDVLQCINALPPQAGCGSAEKCLECELRHNLKEMLTVSPGSAEVDCHLTAIRGGKLVRVELHGNLVRFAIGGQKRLLLCLNDVTAHRRAEAERESLQNQLFQAQKMEAIGHLAGGVAHDFNNLLAAMMLHYNELLEDFELHPSVRNSITELNKLAERAANLTSQLLQYSRQAPMETKTLDLNQCILDMQKLLRRTVGEHIQFSFSPAPQPLWVAGDAGLLGQVLLNLVVNARDAMPNGGDLGIHNGSLVLTETDLAQHPQGWAGRFATLKVTDTGCGMTPEVMAHIFEPFFTTKDTGKGTGLGLATVEGIVKQHHGWVEVQSEPGRGSTFTVFLPLQEGKAEDTPAPSVSSTIAKGTETILVVEDEPAVRRTVANCLRRAGYQVLEAGHAVEARQLWELQKEHIDLLFADMRLPGGTSGWDLACALQAEKPALCLVLTTGYSMEAVGWEKSLAGKATLLTKPYTLAKLTNTIREALQQSAAPSGTS